MCTPPKEPEQEFLIIEKAQEGLHERDVHEICSQSGARAEEGEAKARRLIVNFFGKPCRVELPAAPGDKGNVTILESGKELSLKERILVLYYLKTARKGGTFGEPNEHITFRELKGSGFYYPIFQKRTGWLLKIIEGNEDRLLDIAPELGGSQDELGDISVEFRVLPRVPVSLVMWKGDAEFPPKQSILFDKSISDFLPTECIVVATEILLKKVVALLKG